MHWVWEVSYKLSPLEKRKTAGKKKGILGIRYEALTKYDKGKPAVMRRHWTNDLNMDVGEAIWERKWESVNNISVCRMTRKTQFRILFTDHSHFRHKLDEINSQLCTAGSPIPISMYHIWFFYFWMIWPHRLLFLLFSSKTALFVLVAVCVHVYLACCICEGIETAFLYFFFFLHMV